MRDLIPRKELNTMANRMFDDFWGELEQSLSSTLRPWLQDFRVASGKTKFSYPKINIKDIDNGAHQVYIIEAGVPGLTSKDVKVEYIDGLLIISGSKQNELSSGDISLNNDNQNHYMVRELHKSSFSRSLRIDEELCDVEKIEAGVENGLLTIKIRKKVLDTATPRRIIHIK